MGHNEVFVYEQDEMRGGLFSVGVFVCYEIALWDTKALGSQLSNLARKMPAS